MNERPIIMVSGFLHNMQGWYQEKLTNALCALIQAKGGFNRTADTLEEKSHRDEMINYDLDTAIAYTETVLNVSRGDSYLDDYMPFGLAIEFAKMGKKIARAGWNGKNQYVELATCIRYINKNGDIINADHDNIGSKALAFVGTSGVQLGWLASQVDMLADDWRIVE